MRLREEYGWLVITVMVRFIRFSIFACIELPKNDTQFMRHSTGRAPFHALLPRGKIRSGLDDPVLSGGVSGGRGETGGGESAGTTADASGGHVLRAKPMDCRVEISPSPAIHQSLPVKSVFRLDMCGFAGAIISLRAGYRPCPTPATKSRGSSPCTPGRKGRGRPRLTGFRSGTPGGSVLRRWDGRIFIPVSGDSPGGNGACLLCLQG